MSLQIRSDAVVSLVDRDAAVTRIGDGFQFTEGPVWNREEQCFYFVDLRGDKRWRWSESAGMEVVVSPNFKGNGQAYDADGNLIVCEHVTSSLVRFNLGGSKDILAYHYDGKYLNSPNDVIVREADGGIYFTDPDFGRRTDLSGVKRSKCLDFQGVYRVPDPADGSAELVVDPNEFMQPNGLCFSPDQSVLYVNDTARGEIKAFDVAADGALSGKRLFASGVGESIEPLDPVADEARLLKINSLGRPDGLKCDEHGNVWCTGPGGLWIFAPDGEHLGSLEVPEPIGNFAWGGPNGDLLFICSSSTVHSVTTLVAPGSEANRVGVR
jgi:gluconolactonase